jgi:hypothetical protein
MEDEIAISRRDALRKGVGIAGMLLAGGMASSTAAARESGGRAFLRESDFYRDVGWTVYGVFSPDPDAHAPASCRSLESAPQSVTNYLIGYDNGEVTVIGTARSLNEGDRYEFHSEENLCAYTYQGDGERQEVVQAAFGPL